jgi:epsin
MEFLKKGLSKVKDKVSQVELEKKLAEATTNETGFASISLLNEISSRSDDSEDCKIIVRYCLKIFTLKPKFWKRILKSLNVIEHIVKTGSQNFVDQIKDERDRLRELYNFSYEDDDKDRGEPSKYIYFIKNSFFFYYKSKRKSKAYF